MFVFEYAPTAPSASTISFSSGNFTNNSSYYEKGTTTATTVLYNRRISSTVYSGYGLLLEYQSDGTTKAYANNPATENLDPNELSIDGVTWTDNVTISVGDTLRGRQSSSNPGENFVFTVTSAHVFSAYSWSKTFEVTNSTHRFGMRIHMSKDGTRIIGGGTPSGMLVYHKVSGTWSSTIQLTTESAYTCGISPDGNTIAVGIIPYSSNLGRVGVYKYSGGSWGSVVYVDTTTGTGNYQFGATPRFNNDGTLLVSGAEGYNSSMGAFELWKYESGSWVFKKQFLNPTVKTGHGADNGEFFGTYAAMDNAGTSLIVSNLGNDVQGADYGRVVLYGAVSPPSLTFDGYNKLTLENFDSVREWPPSDGTRGTVTRTNSNKTTTWTISGASYGNGEYTAETDDDVWSNGSNLGYPDMAFNKSLTTPTTSSGFITNNSPQPVELRITLPNAIVLESYKLQGRALNDTSETPGTWTMEGSNDGTTWTVIDTQTAANPALDNSKTATYTVSGN
jgi:hypothetical protein